MNRQMMLIILVGVGGIAGGCAEPAPGTTRSLGAVKYQHAFNTARETMGQYFSIASAESDMGVISSRPKPVQERPERILSGSAARKVARMRLRREDRNVIAYLEIAIQRHGTTEFRRMGPAQHKYDTIPDETPAETDAAATAEQKDVWIVDRYDHALERTILEDLYRKMHPSLREQP